jgi:radical SAM protein with 4Fe4S-binding SPASM domain
MPEPTSLEIQQFHLWDKIRDKRVPLSFDIEITARCNNDCRHCYINLPSNDQAARERELSVEEISRIADQAVKLGAVWCLITGGEPLLRPDFSDIFKLLKRKGLIVSVFTNATLVNREHVALFKKYPPRDIEVTVYGVTRKTYERVTRTSHTFDKFMHGLNLLIENGVRVRLKAMAIQSNYVEQGEIAAFCRARTKDYFRFDPQLHLRFDGDQARNDEIRVERLTPEQIIAQEQADKQRMDTLQNECKSLAEKGFIPCNCDRLFHCGAGNGSFNISYDGRFRLCSSLWAPETVYDLRHGTLAEAWHDFVPRVREMRSTRQTLATTCRVCPLMNICLWCPAHAHLETGEMDGSTPYFCGVAHARHVALRGGSMVD